MAYRIFVLNNYSAYTSTHYLVVEIHLTSELIYFVRTNAGYATSRREIQESIFNNYRARRFGNSNLPPEFFCFLAILASENGLNELAKAFCNVGPV